MRVRCFLALGAIAALSVPAVAESRGSSYTIDELKGIARAVHPTLEAVEAAIERAEGVLRQARAYPNPAFRVAGGRGRPREGGDSRSERDFEVAQPIELPGVRKWRARIAELGVQGAEIERAVAASVVDATVARLAYTVLGEQRRVEIARESAHVAEQLHALLTRRVELDESSPLEAVRAQAEWFARRRDVLDAEGSLGAARSALSVLCGGRLGPRYNVNDTPDRSRPAELPDDVVERMEISNPVLRRAGFAVEQAEAAAELEERAILPRVELFAGRETELDRTATNVGVGLTIPLWNRNRGAIDAAMANRRRTARERDALFLDLERELSRSAAEYRRARAAIELHAEGWTAAAAESLRISTFSFENGEASLLDVLDAQRSNLEVQLAEADAWTALDLARTEIERLIGGRLDAETNDERR
jgi:cobalt-zinc-cadmium efflux system outer membrane protein